jgi:hypothetical protein
MAEYARDLMLVVASEAEIPATDRVWGTGGWLQPEKREALDWLTLARLMGWSVHVARRTRYGLDAGLSGGRCWIMLACDPDDLGEELVALLAARLEAESCLVVARAGARGRTFTRLAGVTRRPESLAGRALRWIGPGAERSWDCRQALDASALELSAEVRTWATLAGAPLIVARQVGRGVVVTLGFHPSQARDVDGAATALLQHLLIWGAASPIAWFDLAGSLILRMDDPGSAEHVYHHGYICHKLGEADWTAIAADLRRRNGRMSVGYVSGWVDSGDVTRGRVKVAGRVPRRVPGQVYPSPLVQYQDLTGYAPGTLYDYEAEFRGIQALRAAGLGDVELHGHTHMHPDSASWVQAPDRYEATLWYRELGKAAQDAIASRPPDKHPLVLGLTALRQYFEVQPTTLICPGDQWTDSVLERALDLGLQLMSSYYLAIRHDERFCWTQHVCAPYLDKPNAAWFDAGLPVVGYCHDFDLARQGVDWMSQWLDQWRAVGARQLMDLRELAAVVGRRLLFEKRDGKLLLTVERESAPALVRPLAVFLRMPGRQLPSHVSVWLDGRDLSLQIHPLGDGLGRVILPCSSEGTTYGQ